MAPNPKGTHCRVCVSPRFAIRGRSAFLYMQGKDPLHSTMSVFEVGHCPCSDKRMGDVSIVNGNVCGRFHGCWHGRFVVFFDLLRVH
jgi:hypothetical protein